jgi:hypothetical protein
MTTRFNAIDQVNRGVSGVKSGYDSLNKSDLSIPSCGIEDVDVAIFKLFENEIQPMVGGIDTAEVKKVPIVFAAGEKWALLKRGKPIRDKTNTLILPLITIMRASVTQSPSDVTGRGINQQTGEIFVRRRLDKQDRDYQNLINKLFVVNQPNAFVNSEDKLAVGQAVTGRKIGSLKSTREINDGALLTTNRKNNVYETLVVPSPHFYTAVYTITIWTQYTQHMNQIVEKLIASYLPQAQSWKLTTSKGYWFVATTDGGSYPIETNFDDMSAAERFIKCTFNVNVPAYFWALSLPGMPVPVKRYVSSPVIEFKLTQDGLPNPTPDQQETFSNNFLIGNDDPSLPIDEVKNSRPDQRRSGGTLTPNRGSAQTSNPELTFAPANVLATLDPTTQDLVVPGEAPVADPSIASAPRGAQIPIYTKIQVGDSSVYTKVVSKNSSTGETVYAVVNSPGMEIVPVK